MSVVVKKNILEKILENNLDKKENKGDNVKISFLENNIKERDCLELINNYFKNYDVGYFNIETFNHFINNELEKIIKSKELNVEHVREKYPGL